MLAELVFSAKASRDIETIIKWYDGQSILAGDWFLIEVNTHINKIVKNPERFAQVSTDIRRCLLKRFPYKIFYSFGNKTVIILRVRHNKQRTLKRYT